MLSCSLNMCWWEFEQFYLSFHPLLTTALQIERSNSRRCLQSSFIDLEDWSSNICIRWFIIKKKRTDRIILRKPGEVVRDIFCPFEASPLQFSYLLLHLHHDAVTTPSPSPSTISMAGAVRTSPSTPITSRCAPTVPIPCPTRTLICWRLWRKSTILCFVFFSVSAFAS